MLLLLCFGWVEPRVGKVEGVFDGLSGKFVWPSLAADAGFVTYDVEAVVALTDE